MASTVPMVQPSVDRFSMNWIVNKKTDLLLFIGGALTGYIMFFLHAGLHPTLATVEKRSNFKFTKDIIFHCPNSAICLYQL